MVTGTDLNRPRTIEGITRPDPRHHYGQIIAWIVCWPWNMLWTFCVHNPFRYIGEFALHEIRSTLDEIATGEFSEIERDLEETPVVPAPAPAPATTQARPVFMPDKTERENEEQDAVETVDEASFVAASAEPEREREDQAGIETLEESPAWESMLQVGPGPETSADASSSEGPATYTPPAGPPIRVEDPWYYAPPGENQNGQTLPDAWSQTPNVPPESN